MLEQDFILPAQFSIAAPHVEDYFGLWAMEPDALCNIVNRYQGLNLHAHISSSTARQAATDQAEREYQVTPDGIAIFRVSGPTMKSTSSMSGGTSTIAMRRQIRSARQDSVVRGGMLISDTPGGTVKGNQDFADEVARFNAAKPLYAFIEDMTASAGVSVVSQATKRFANNPTALYAAMGTYGVLIDASGRAEQLGIKVHVVRAGEFKGTGEPGTEITEAQLREAQRIVNAMNENYLGLIARGLGRSVEEIRPMADGRTHTAADAVGMGLINGVQSYDETYEQLVAATSPKKQFSLATPVAPRSKVMEAATLTELKQKFPKSTAEWRESQLEAGATLNDAAIAYAAHVEERTNKQLAEQQAAHEKALADAKAAAPPADPKQGTSLGHNPVTLPKGRRAKAAAGDELEAEEEVDRQEYIESGDAIEDFNAAVAKIAGPRADYGRRSRAIRQVASKNPELYEAYILACNTGSSKKARLITEKLEAARK